MSDTKETLSFQAEARQLLDLMIHSLYSNKEIFLRELISNASDAADKLRFEASTDDSLYEGDADLHVHVAVDTEARTITVRDNGIGMSREEVVDNIGTIARSGTRQFLDTMSGDREKDAHLIGQFGVGFYSAFLVAERVTLLTRRAGMEPEHGVRWESAGDGAYKLENGNRAARGSGAGGPRTAAAVTARAGGGAAPGGPSPYSSASAADRSMLLGLTTPPPLSGRATAAVPLLLPAAATSATPPSGEGMNRLGRCSAGSPCAATSVSQTIETAARTTTSARIVSFRLKKRKSFPGVTR